VVNDREERGDEANAQSAMRVIEVTQPGVDAEARWVKKGDKSLFGYKQHTIVYGNGLVDSDRKPLRPIVMTASRCWICSIKPIFNLELAFMLTKPIVAKSTAML